VNTLARLLVAQAIAAAVGGCFLPAFTADEGQGAGGSAGKETSTGSGPPVEDCTNGRDDDGDDRIDCEDPDCAAFTCVPQAPEGWNGPFVGATGPGCDGPWDERVALHAGQLQAAPAECACACEAPGGGACGVPSTLVWSADDGCTSAVVMEFTPNGIDCTPVDGEGVGQLRGDPVPVANPGACAPRPSTVLPAPNWEKTVGMCAGAPGACSDPGQACVPRGGASCVTRDGDVPCPTGPYAERAVMYGEPIDTRGCTPCTCGPVQGAFCTGRTEVYFGSGSCNGAHQTIPNDGASCEVARSDVVGSVRFRVTNGPAGACAPSPVTPLNGVALPGQVTLCCTAR
jgi:hypothetical protein